MVGDEHAAGVDRIAVALDDKHAARPLPAPGHSHQPRSADSCSNKSNRDAVQSEKPSWQTCQWNEVLSRPDMSWHPWMRPSLVDSSDTPWQVVDFSCECSRK